MASVQANGITIEYEVSGEGEPLLFVMGLGAQLTAWNEQFVALFVEQGFQVIRFDNRDCGLSTHFDTPPPPRKKVMQSFVTRRPLNGADYTIADMADDAAGLLGALDIEQAHLMGVSMGGMICQEIAIRHPERVRSLCSIMSNTGDRKNGGVAAQIIPKMLRRQEPTRENAIDVAVETFKMFGGPHFDSNEHRALTEAAFARSFTPDGVARQTAAIAASRDRTALLATVGVPTLVIHGLVDPLIKPSGGEATARAIPHSRLLTFPDMGHDLPRPRWIEIRDEVVTNARRASDER